MAQVINEDEETSPSKNKEAEGPNDSSSKQEEIPTEEEEDEGEPNGSQYNSKQEGYPLDEYKEFIKVKYFDDDDTDVVYIRSAWESDKIDLSDITRNGAIARLNVDHWDNDQKTNNGTNDQDLNNHVFIHAMHGTDDMPHAYRNRVNRTQGAIHRPKRVKNKQLCLAAYIKIKDVQAYDVLFNSGSTTDAVTPDFTRVAGHMYWTTQ